MFALEEGIDVGSGVCVDYYISVPQHRCSHLKHGSRRGGERVLRGAKDRRSASESESELVRRNIYIVFLHLLSTLTSCEFSSSAETITNIRTS